MLSWVASGDGENRAQTAFQVVVKLVQGETLPASET
jgi:hypothetical protein